MATIMKEVVVCDTCLTHHHLTRPCFKCGRDVCRTHWKEYREADTLRCRTTDHCEITLCDNCYSRETPDA